MSVFCCAVKAFCKFLEFFIDNLLFLFFFVTSFTFLQSEEIPLSFFEKNLIRIKSNQVFTFYLKALALSYSGFIASKPSRPI